MSRNWMGTVLSTAVATVTGTAGMVGGGADCELQPSDNKQRAAVMQISTVMLLDRDKMASLT
ncbi:MAG TPA: hypothetical protein VMT32_15970 [Bryobacteraceae bacterium]|nr:hypothetical protein [Bryobacteraceae bacterium]